MKRFLIVFAVVVLLGGALNVMAEKHGMHMMMQETTNETNAVRVSLKLNPKMKQHLLKNMQSHVEAVRSIIGLMAEGKFNKASETAHAKLGLTPQMQRMCSMFKNDGYREMGFAFHKSADKLGEILKTGDMNRSLHALNATMNYCVTCHRTFRQ